MIVADNHALDYLSHTCLSDLYSIFTEDTIYVAEYIQIYYEIGL